MARMTEAYDWRGRTLIDPDGEKIGQVDELYMDSQTEEPEWAKVTTGLLGRHSSLVPLAGAEPRGEDVMVSVTKEQVENSPHSEPEGELSRETEEALFRHYGISYSDEGSVTATDVPRAP
jgi:hypothetical protein